jgi:hypothetical protein
MAITATPAETRHRPASVVATVGVLIFSGGIGLALVLLPLLPSGRTHLRRTPE